jgi:hydrophobe/amphiphile efflux-1 (HAE1) family protein
MIPQFFIRRPIFAIVVAIFMILIGLYAFKELPIAEYPEITPPTVMVSATYPGADAETVAHTVGEPIEQQVNGVEGMMYMSSQSGSDGSYNLTVTFETGTDIDEATVKVQNRVSQVQSTLPEAVIEQGVTVNSQSSDILMFMALEGDSATNFDALYLTNYAQLHIVDNLARIKGVGEVQAFGSGEYSMRVWLDPQKMQIRGITPADIRAVITSQNVDVSAGSVGAPPGANNAQFQFTLTSKGMLKTPEEFGDIIVKSDDNGGILRLRDVAEIQLGSESYAQVARLNGKPTALIAVNQSSGANALDVAKGVKEEMNRLAEYFPEGMRYQVIMDTTTYITASIEELAFTFIITTLIVMVVILIFLQNWRATIIPMLTIPVSIIATFAVMKLLGFSINTLTLFGLVLAIAIVVDDAIVVVEDCARLITEDKLQRQEAAERSMKELQSPIIGEVLVLMSVFIPTAFVSGITGELYKQFALTIAISTAFSGINALTFTPAMCALFLRPTKPSRFFLYKWFNKGYGAALAAYMRIIGSFLKRPWVALGIYLAITAAAFWGFIKTPTSYIPKEDLGYFMTSIELPAVASLQRTDAVTKQVAEAIKGIPGVKDVISVSGHSFMGGSGTNMSGCFVMLKPWSERKGKEEQINAIIAKADEITARFQEPIVFSINPPAIPGLGNSGGLDLKLLDINNLGARQLSEAIAQLQESAKEAPEIAGVTTLYQGSVPQYVVKVDRDKVDSHGLEISEVYAALSSYVGGTYVNDFEEFGRMYHVKINSAGADRMTADDVLRLSVKNSEGDMVPFAAFAQVVPSMGTSEVNRYNMYTCASVTATVADGVSSSEGIAAMENLVNSSLGDNYSYAWSGEAYQETQAGTTINFMLIFSVIVTLLVLAAQYSSWTDPVAVIIAMPTAILGTLLGCALMHQSISIYTQIGIILLLGLSAKNAILIVEYAKDYRQKGESITDAAMEGGRLRFRPIMMTAFAFILGVLPMLFATGAGAASRLSLGSAVVFGMFINAVAGTLFVPNFWEILQRFGEKYIDPFFRMKHK